MYDQSESITYNFRKVKMTEGHGFQKLSKIASSKALVIRVNLVFLALFFVVYAGLLLQPAATVYYQNAAVSLIKCSFSDCHQNGKVRIFSLT